MNNRLPYGAAVLTFILLTIFANQTDAQTIQGQRLDKFAPDFWGKRKEPKNFYRLKEAIDLPGLPAYTSKVKFLNGIMEDNPAGGANYQMNLLSKDSQKEIIDWYRNTLLANNWQLMNSMSNTLVAKDANRDMCSINVSADNKLINGQRYKSKLTMMYRQRTATKQ